MIAQYFILYYIVSGSWLVAIAQYRILSFRSSVGTLLLIMSCSWLISLRESNEVEYHKVDLLLFDRLRESAFWTLHFMIFFTTEIKCRDKVQITLLQSEWLLVDQLARVGVLEREYAARLSQPPGLAGHTIADQVRPPAKYKV